MFIDLKSIVLRVEAVCTTIKLLILVLNCSQKKKKKLLLGSNFALAFWETP